MTNLTSRSNPRIKQIHQLLRQRKARDSSALFVAEGIRHVGEACAAGAGVEYIVHAPQTLTSDFARQLVHEQAQKGIPCLEVSEDVFRTCRKITPGSWRPPASSKVGDLSATQWGVALVAPQDPGNIGSILRTIDAVGASGLLLLDDLDSHQFSADPFHPGSVRASMGRFFGTRLLTPLLSILPGGCG
jgi:TrmH family RNA methyltransferase